MLPFPAASPGGCVEKTSPCLCYLNLSLWLVSPSHLSIINIDILLELGSYAARSGIENTQFYNESMVKVIFDSIAERYHREEYKPDGNHDRGVN